MFISPLYVWCSGETLETDMGKIIRGVLLIILVAMLSGCQSTPEDSVVVGKDAAAFEEKLKEKASVSAIWMRLRAREGL